MSNDIYKILNNFNKLTEQKPQPTEQKAAAKPKTQLQESIEQVNEKYMGFKKTVAARKLSEMDKSQPSSDRGGESSGDPYAKGGKATPIKPKDMSKHALKVLNKKMNIGRYGDGSTITDRNDPWKGVKEEQQDESALQAYLGKKKYGEQGMKALQQAGREGASKEKMAKIRAQHDKMDEQQGVAEGTAVPWQVVINALASGYPDLDPTDSLAPIMRKYGVDFDDLNLLARRNGYNDIYAVLDEFGQDQGVAEGKLDQLPTRGADYSKYDTDHLKTLLKPGILHRNEARFKALIRKELRKREQQSVAEGKKPDRYHIVGKDGKPVNLASYADRASAIKDRDEKYPGAVVQQVGPRGAVKGVSEGSLNEKAVSKAQQKFMGMVHAAQKGGKAASPEVAKVAKGMSKKAAKDYASTKHKGLPQHVNETIIQALKEGYTKEQIVQYLLKESDKDYWKELIKDIPDKGSVTKTAHKGHYGTEYQGDEDDDDDDGKKKIAKPTGEKRGRGRPKGVKNRQVRAGVKKAAPTGEKRGRGRPPGSKNKMKEAWELEHNKLIAEAYVKLVEAELGQTYNPARMPNLPPPVPQDPTYKKDPKTGQLVPDVPKPAPAPKPAAPKGTEKRSDIEGDTAVAEMMRLAGMEGKLHGKQHKLDVDKDGDIEADDLADLRAGKHAVEEGDMEEGNEFTGALGAARDAGKKEFEVDGKTYPVKESQLDECGEMGPMANGMSGEQAGKMNISTNMDSDGHKTVTVSADGEAAIELMQMLALAGMKQPEAQMHNEPEIAVMSMEDKDPRYEASTTPEEDIIPLETQLKGGDGDVAGKEKQMNPHGSARFSDNPLAVKESMSSKLMKEYEAIKVKK